MSAGTVQTRYRVSGKGQLNEHAGFLVEHARVFSQSDTGIPLHLERGVLFDDYFAPTQKMGRRCNKIGS